MPIDDNVNPDPSAQDLSTPSDSTGDGATGDSDSASVPDDDATGD